MMARVRAFDHGRLGRGRAYRSCERRIRNGRDLGFCGWTGQRVGDSAFVLYSVQRNAHALGVGDSEGTARSEVCASNERKDPWS